MFEELPRKVIYELLGNSAAAAECERADKASSIAESAVKLLESNHEHPPLTREHVAALFRMDLRGPELCTLDEFDNQTLGNESLSRHTAGRVVRQLIEWDLAERPMGPRKGATLTSKGHAVVSELRRNLGAN